MAAAASRFAAALFHRRTRRVTSALAYAVLEWTLIVLLLINGLFSYAIARFAAYFGLRPPCLLCSRVDRLFEGKETEEDGARWLRSVLCGAHAAEISGLGYCQRHGRLAEAGDMCEACLSPSKEGKKGVTACSCCNAIVETSSRELPYTVEGLTEEKIAEEEKDQEYVPLAQEEHGEEGDHREDDDDQGYILLAQEEHNEEDGQEQEEFQEKDRQEEGDNKDEQEEKMAVVEDESLEVMALAEEIELVAQRLVSVAAIDEMTVADESGLHQECCEKDKEVEHVDGEQELRDLDIGVVLEEKRMLDSPAATVAGTIEDDSVVPIPSAETIPSPSDSEENSIPQDDEMVTEDVEIGDTTAQEEEIVVPEVTEAVPEDDNRSSEVDTNCEVSIGSEICEQDDHVVPFHESEAFEESVPPLAYTDKQPLPLETLRETDPTVQGTTIIILCI
uniref:GTD-binding domain-containing protein n=1 Tax=Leersia perrieri TaxID=77586 RepID=A0A0D9VS49_9ORYZ